MKNKDLWLAKAKTLSEALPYMKKFAGEVFVIKFGGSAMGDEETIHQFAHDVVLMKQVGINPIVVHGGGPQIGQLLERLKIKSSFINGLRVTDAETVEIVEMVLSGTINKSIVSAIHKAGGVAIGVSGKDGNMIEARKIRRTIKDPDSNIEKILDLGFVGEPSKVNPEILTIFDDSDVIPVVAPIGIGENGETYNINADMAAGAIASALGAAKLIILSNIDGILDAKKELIERIDVYAIKQLIAKGIITDGMIPKVETCIHALENSVESCHIVNGLIPHVLLIEILTEHGAGTMIVN